MEEELAREMPQRLLVARRRIIPVGIRQIMVLQARRCMLLTITLNTLPLEPLILKH